MAAITPEVLGSHEKEHGHDNHLPGTASTVFGTNGAGLLAEIEFNVAALVNQLAQRDAGGQVEVPLNPTAGKHAASRAYVDAQFAGGKTWKELVLVETQLRDGNGVGGVRQALLLTLVQNLQPGDTISIADGVTTEVFTAIAPGVPAANQFVVAVSGSAATIANLAAAITADSLKYNGQASTAFDGWFSGGQVDQLVLYVLAQESAGAANTRVFGTIANSQADVQVIDFNGAKEYASNDGVQGNLLGADGGVGQVGFGRLFALLASQETHKIVDGRSEKTWAGDSDVWFSSGISANTAGAGLANNAGVIDLVAADNSLIIGPNDVAVKVDGVTLETNPVNGVQVKDGSLTIAKTSYWKPQVTQTGPRPAKADFTGVISVPGDVAISVGTNGKKYWNVGALDGAFLEVYSVQMGKLV